VQGGFFLRKKPLSRIKSPYSNSESACATADSTRRISPEILFSAAPRLPFSASRLRRFWILDYAAGCCCRCCPASIACTCGRLERCASQELNSSRML
jgi:hypothetical protein